MLLLVFVVCGILLSPLGFETRAPAFLSSPSSLPWLGLALAGLMLNGASLIVVLFRARIASILATIGSIGSIALFLADQTGLAVSARPPPAITVLETITTGLLVATILVASRGYRETSFVLATHGLSRPMAGGDREVSAIRAIAEASILITLAFLITILGGFVVTVWIGQPPVFPPPWNLLGLPIAVAGAGSLVYCGAFLSRHGRGTPYPRLPPKRLVTTGPFARVRNPIIVSWGALLIGVGVTMNWTGLLLLMVPAFGVIQAYLVSREEPTLRKRFPAEYEAYRARVPRWIPRLRT